MDSIMYNRVYIYFICSPVNSVSWIPSKSKLKVPILHGEVMRVQKKAVKTNNSTGKTLKEIQKKSVLREKSTKVSALHSH